MFFARFVRIAVVPGAWALLFVGFALTFTFLSRSGIGWGTELLKREGESLRK